MKQYTFEIIIDEGEDEFWDEINKKGITGCDEVKECLVSALAETGFTENYGTKIKIKEFKNI